MFFKCFCDEDVGRWDDEGGIYCLVREGARKSDNRIDLVTTRRSGDRDVKDSPAFAPCALLMENDSVARPCCLSLCPELLHQCKKQRTNALRAMDLDLGLLLESAPSATGQAQMQQLQKGGTTHAD